MSCTTRPTMLFRIALPRCSVSVIRTNAAASSPISTTKRFSGPTSNTRCRCQGDIKSRFFYALGGGVQKNHLYGLAATPRVGFVYAPVLPSSRLFHGTRLRANFATGVQEPSLALEFASLYNQLLAGWGYGGYREVSRCAALDPQRSHTYDIGVDQNIIGQKLIAQSRLLPQRLRPPARRGRDAERWSRSSDIRPAWLRTSSRRI